MRFLKYLPLLLLLSPTRLMAANEAYPLDLHLTIMGLETATTPQILDNSILFTYTSTSKSATRYVGIAFAGENFTTIHTMDRNQHGVFFYVYPISAGESTVEYRIVVDGLWTHDPRNATTVEDAGGIPLSVVSIPPRAVPVTVSPIVSGDGEVQFLLRAPDNRSITVIGDFNHWDPFMTPLTEVTKGLYSVTLRVSPGVHAYNYVSDGTTLPDPLNPHVNYYPDGSSVSVFDVP
jgi:Carbohydrate-binding module 48 (Isoamylase N-terminal domain)